MYDTPRGHFVSFVLPAFEDYMNERSKREACFGKDLRVAKNAATYLYHMREHMPACFTKSTTDLAKSCPDYSLLNQIANALKHREQSKKSKKQHGPWLFDSAADIYEIQVITQYSDEFGPYYVTTKEVVVKQRDGTIREFSGVFRNVVNMWIDELATHGVGTFPKISEPDSSPPKRESAGGAGRFDCSLKAGEDHVIHYQMRRYDHEKKKSVPIDIAGHQYEMTLRKPPEIKIVWTNNATGEQVAIPIGQLEVDEWNQFESLAADEDKQEFLKSLYLKSVQYRALRRMKDLIVTVRNNKEGRELSVPVRLTDDERIRWSALPSDEDKNAYLQSVFRLRPEVIAAEQTLSDKSQQPNDESSASASLSVPLSGNGSPNVCLSGKMSEKEA
jgi:hypothetical protein